LWKKNCAASQDNLDDRQRASKLSRLLADPRTPDEVSRKLGADLIELSNETGVHVDHPAIVERAASVMFESIETSDYPDSAKRIYDHLHKLLNELPDIQEGSK
jgi:hypothetical protein